MARVQTGKEKKRSNVTGASGKGEEVQLLHGLVPQRGLPEGGWPRHREDHKRALVGKKTYAWSPFCATIYAIHAPEHDVQAPSPTSENKARTLFTASTLAFILVQLDSTPLCPYPPPSHRVRG